MAELVMAVDNLTFAVVMAALMIVFGLCGVIVVIGYGKRVK